MAPRCSSPLASIATPIKNDTALQSWWRSHHAALLRDVRVGTAIPEAEPLDEAPRSPDRPPIGPVVLPLHKDPSLQEAMQEAADCHRCHLYQAATQTVFGEGPAHAKVMFVGEQPGDQEDIIGRPFVGPAGQIMDRAMEEAGIDRRTRLHHQCGEALQVHAARQAPHPPDAGKSGDSGLPLLARRGAGAAASETGGGHGWHRRACAG